MVYSKFIEFVILIFFRFSIFWFFRSLWDDFLPKLLEKSYGLFVCAHILYSKQKVTKNHRKNQKIENLKKNESYKFYKLRVYQIL